MTRKTRRQKLEDLVEAMTKVLPNSIGDQQERWSDEFKNLHRVYLTLSEPSTPEQTADDVWRLWEIQNPNIAKSSLDRPEDFIGVFFGAYRVWEATQAKPKIYAFEVTEELLDKFNDWLCKQPFLATPKDQIEYIRELTAKDAT